MKGSSYIIMMVVVVSLLNCHVECEGCLEEERSLLLQLKSSLNLSNEDSLALSWGGQNCCEWGFVSCSNTTSRVSQLDLGVVRLHSADRIWYPKESVNILSQFKELQYLIMSSNRMGGSDILQEFCKLQYLKELQLASCSLEGKIPHCIGKMHSLQFLDLSDNQLQGTVSPSTFNNLTMITYLSLSNNHFVGTIPFSMFANLSKLIRLDLSNNYQLEVETESPNWVPHFQLAYLDLANCKLNRLSGSIVPSFLSTQHTLGSLDLSNSSLAGDIPSYLLYNSTQFLWLQGNSFSGPFPLPHQNTTSPLTSLDISYNLVYGSLPENFVDLFPILNYCDMSANALQGNLPPKMGIGYLQSLLLSDNNFTGEMPPGLSRIFFLDLSNNRLQGEMLPGNVSMEGIVCLKLDGNEFTTPLNISKTPYLVILNIRNNHLSGNISSWLPVHQYLTVLLVRGNRFEGSIPSHICQMESLQVLDLSYNSLGGAVPSCLASVPSWKSTRHVAYDQRRFKRIPIDLITKGISYNFTGWLFQQMTLIDLSSNKLMGAIPFEMGNMTWLRSLNLSHNLLNGSLPVSFQNMENLESLDLSHNNLTGKIPQEFTNLSFMGTFNVAFNNLSGEIPSQGQFLTFTNSSYEGNQGLCGTPLSVDCSSNNPKHPNENGKVEEKEENGILDNDLFYYSCVAISYCLGFWGSIGLLFFSSWRKKFYMTMDAFQDWCFWKLWRMVRYIRNRCCNQ